MAYGIRDRTHAWIKDFLTDRKQYAKVDGKSSDLVRVTSGVPRLTRGGYCCYKSTPKYIEVFQPWNTPIIYNLTEITPQYRLTNGKCFTILKSANTCILAQEMRILNTMNTGQEVIEIETVTSEQDLGVIMDKALYFSEHINSKVNKANRNL